MSAVGPVETLPVETLADVRDAAAMQARIVEEILAIDAAISAVLDKIVAHPRFADLAGRWRALAWLLDQADEADDLRIELFQASSAELNKEIGGRIEEELEQSHLHRILVDDPLRVFGGSPFGLILIDAAVADPVHGGDHQTVATIDIDRLARLAWFGREAMAPIILHAPATLLDVPTFADLGQMRDTSRLIPRAVQQVFDQLRGASGQAGEYLALGLPTIRLSAARPARVPWVRRTDGMDDGGFWIGGGWALAAVVARCFVNTGWFMDLVGLPDDYDGGGVPPLGLGYTPRFDRAAAFPAAPVETALLGGLLDSLGQSGFSTIVATAHAGVAVIHAAQAIDRPLAGAAPGLCLTLCVARLAQYITLIGRETIGFNTDATYLQKLLEEFLFGYCDDRDDLDAFQRALRPLRECSVRIEPSEARPGHYQCEITVSPHLPFGNEQVKVARSSAIRAS